MYKQTLSVLLAILLVFSLSAVAFAGGTETTVKDIATVGATPDEYPPEQGGMTISFDTTTTGWKDFAWVAFHIWAIDDEDFVGYDWGAKKQRGTDEDEDGIWSYDLGNCGLTFKDYCTYAVIFYTDGGAQTYNLLFGPECYGATAYCDSMTYENPEDSNKTTLAAFWRDIDPEMFGPELKITSIGNVVGTCCPMNTSPSEMLVNFVNNTMDNALQYTEMTAQQIIDNIGVGLGFTLEELEELIADNNLDVEWDAADSTVPSMYDPTKRYVDYNYDFAYNSGKVCFAVEKGETLSLSIRVAAEKLIGCVKGYIEFDPAAFEAIGIRPFEDEKPYFTAQTRATDDEPERVYFDIDLADGADYLADEKDTISYKEINYDDGKETLLYDLKGLTIATIDVEMIAEEPGVYSLSCVLTDVEDAEGNVLMKDGDYKDNELFVDTELCGEEPEYARGDADMDGVVSIMDATRIQRVLAKLAGEDELDSTAADADSDGDITIMDATRIQRVLAKLCDMDGNLTEYVTEKEACDAVLAYINNEEGYTAVCMGKELDRFGKEEYFKIDLRHYNGIGSSHADWFYVAPYKIGKEVLVLNSTEFNEI